MKVRPFRLYLESGCDQIRSMCWSLLQLLTQAPGTLISWVEGVMGASLCVSVLVPDRRTSKSPETSKRWQCLWTLRTRLGAWVPRWLHWKSRDTFLRWAGIRSYLGQTSPAVGPKYEQQDTKRPKPNCKAVSRTWSLQTAPPRGCTDHPAWPPDPPPPSSHWREPVTYSCSLLLQQGPQ